MGESASANIFYGIHCAESLDDEMDWYDALDKAEGVEVVTDGYHEDPGFYAAIPGTVILGVWEYATRLDLDHFGKFDTAAMDKVLLAFAAANV